MNGKAVMAWGRRAAAAAFRIPTLILRLPLFLLKGPSPDDAVLPVSVGDGEYVREKEVATYASWSKLSIPLSFSGGLSLASVPSSLIHEKWASFATCAIGTFVGFLLAMAVYSTCCFLRKTVIRALLFTSSLIISVAFAVILTVVLDKGAYANLAL